MSSPPPRGADVAVADINSETAAETVAMVEERGGKALLIEMDTSKIADAERMAAEVLDAFGTIDGLVCCAIKLVPGKLEELPEADWDMVMDIGLKGYFLCAQAAGRVMLDKGRGSIVFVSSHRRHADLPSRGRLQRVQGGGDHAQPSSSAWSGAGTAFARTPSLRARCAPR